MAIPGGGSRMPNQSRGLHNDQWVASVNRTNNRTTSVLKLLFISAVAC
jgi:hypothetical protein